MEVSAMEITLLSPTCLFLLWLLWEGTVFVSWCPDASMRERQMCLSRAWGGDGGVWSSDSSCLLVAPSCSATSMGFFFFSFGLTCKAAESLQSNTAFQRKCASTLSALHSQWRHHFPVKDLQERENNDGFNASRKAPFVHYGSMLFLTEIDVELYH